MIAQRQAARIQADAVESSGTWSAQLAVEIADTCLKQRFVEVERVETINRKVDARTVAIPFAIGIVTAIATPIVASYTAQNGDPLYNQPVPTQDILIGLAVGEGVGTILIGVGAATIDVSKRGAGTHENLISTEIETRGPVGEEYQCRWRLLREGTLVLTPDDGDVVKASISQGVGVVPLPPPSAVAPLRWSIELPGVEGAIELDLSSGTYADRSYLARTESELAAGRISSAVGHFEGIRESAAGRGELRTRLQNRVKAVVEEALQDDDPEYGLALMETGDALELRGSPLWERAVVALAKLRLSEGEFGVAVEVGNRLAEGIGSPESVETLFEAYEDAFVGRIANGNHDQAEAIASLAEPLMGPEWARGAEERVVVAKVLTGLEGLLSGSPDPNTERPAEILTMLADLRSRLVEGRGTLSPWFPEHTIPPAQAFADYAAALVRPVGFAARFSASPAAVADPDGEWIAAAMVFAERFPEHPDASSLAQRASEQEARYKAARKVRDDFDVFSADFARAAAQNYLATQSGVVDAVSPGSNACRAGRQFVKDYGTSKYRSLAGEFCAGEFPSSWTYGSGSWNERTIEVPLRACTAFFKAPRGCD